MNGTVYQFRFGRKLSLTEAEMTLQLAMIALEGLLGQARVRLEASYRLHRPRRVICVDGATEVGQALARVFTALIIREFGERSFHVRRVAAGPDVLRQRRAA